MSEYRVPSIETRCDQLESEAYAFLRENPAFWEEFCHWTFRMIRRGYKRYSHKTIVAVLRYHSDHEFGPDAEGYKINDHHSATFARIFMRTYPEHNRFFPIRERPSALRRPYYGPPFRLEDDTVDG
jgi:hypothetical protein